MPNDYIDATGDKVDDPNGQLMGGHALAQRLIDSRPRQKSPALLRSGFLFA
jgi:hypothetical protein